MPTVHRIGYACRQRETANMNQKRTSTAARQAKQVRNPRSIRPKSRDGKVREAAERVVKRHEKALRELAKH